MTRHHDVHVTADPDRAAWKVTQGGRTLSHHRTQTNAVNAGKRRSRRDHVDLVTHRRDGRVRSKDGYGNEGSTRNTEY
jgi:hypothetical protein